ncbi:acyl-CoA dehydrogenase [Streptomyces lacrimifluminis]|uniref:Acyl-CoA dehydrogenase n=1 Tax=Streptomyces lacrimifluminis TaxID=1500077 RepID=A0A917P982_9ACTN|nr:acyl-CoA dehydrogenase family protein [Streptomyces lacrimifluminis]GGJ67451.1 acyl-CoA dehydrogenase [Streptomyces lacrimifluminis]
MTDLLTGATRVPVDRDATLERIHRFEALLGDPDDPDNPLGLRAVLDADERGELLPEGERALARFGLGAEFVPAALGGRFERADRFSLLMRSLFRRDCSLGIGHGVTSFIAGLPVWADGSPEQRRRAAELLCRGGRIVAAYTELDHGSDFARVSLAARPAPGGYLLDGGKQLVNNIGRAEAAVLFARTDDRPGSRGHSHLLVDLDGLPADRTERSARYATSGVRGCLLGGVDFDNCPVPADALLGLEGGAMETVLKVFQVTRCVLPGMVVGIGDAQLRAVLAFAGERRLYGKPVSALPLPRSVLTDAFVDLLICDALSMVAARSLHLLPEEASVRAAAVKYLVPKLLQDNSYRLGVLLGARGYVREGPYAGFQKAARDLPVVALAHASGAVCLSNIVPQLPRLADRAWRPALDRAPDAPVAPETVFRLHDSLPALDFARLALTTRGADSLAGVLPALADELAREATDRPEVAELAVLADVFTGELADLARRAGSLPPRDRTPVAGRRAFLLAERYVLLLAAAACLGVWRAAGTDDPFLADPLWATAALRRLAEQLGLSRDPLPEPVVEALFEELAGRHRSARTFDLFRTGLATQAVPAKGVDR